MALNITGGPLWLFCGASLAIACQSVLGIEDLSEDPRPGALGGNGGDAGSDDPGRGGTDTGGAGVSTGGSSAGGSNGGSAGSEPLPEPPDGGAPDGGEAGGPFVVAGRVIDFFRRPVPNTPVTIGGTTVATNAQGEFSISGVATPYTASLILTMTRNNSPARYGYVYEGLTRSDPTLQVYSALPQRSADSLFVSFQNVFDANQFATLAFSSPDGRFVDEDRTSSVTILGSPAWTGPATITGNIHALLAVGDPPTDFESYQTFPLAATDEAPASASFDLEPTDIPAGNLSGTATGGVIDLRSNYVALRFTDGTAMPLLDETATTDAFSYLVPSLPGSTFVVAAADGDSFAPYAVAHRENIAFGQTGIALSVPNPVTLNSPQDGGAVTPSTTYSWSALSQTAQTFLWHLEFNQTFEGMFVLTSRTQIELPEFADGFTVPAGTGVLWSVETHGDAPTTDAVTGTNGYLDSFSLLTNYPVGPNRSDGYYTESQRRGFIMGED